MKITEHLTSSQKRKIFVRILLLLVFTGIIIGTFLVNSNFIKTELYSGYINQKLIEVIENKNIIKVFADFFLPVVVILLFQMICGLFAIGQPFCFITLIHRGIAGGVSAAFIYLSYGLRGFFIILIMLIPSLVLSIFIIMLGARESIKLSNHIVNILFRHLNNGYFECKLYIIKFLTLILFAFLSAALHCVLIYFSRGLLL